MSQQQIIKPFLCAQRLFDRVVAANKSVRLYQMPGDKYQVIVTSEGMVEIDSKNRGEILEGPAKELAGWAIAEGGAILIAEYEA